MIYSTITILIASLCLVTLTQPNAPRLFAALVFVGVTLSHEVFLSNYDGLSYYGGAALFDLAIIIATSGIRPLPQMVLSLHKICLVSILANFMGWVIWFLYFPPIIYDISFVVIYTWALITLIKRSGLDVGGYTLDSWAVCFCFNSSTWRSYCSYYKGKV